MVLFLAPHYQNKHQFKKKKKKKKKRSGSTAAAAMKPSNSHNKMSMYGQHTHTKQLKSNHMTQHHHMIW
jgi:hypothetical protein